jgi:serine/threonine protein phosphatase PrpC
LRITVSKIRYIGARKDQQDVVNVFQTTARAGSKAFVCGVLTDGIGGLEHGGEASEVVNAAAGAALDAALRQTEPESGAIDNVLRDSVAVANGELQKFQASRTTERCGSTLLIGLIGESQFHFVSVGDSIILERDRTGRITRLNQAHVARQNNRDALTSAILGAGGVNEIDGGSLDLSERGARQILMSSDGLKTLPIADVGAILAQDAPDKLQQIVALAEAGNRGNQDNLSMILFDLAP